MARVNKWKQFGDAFDAVYNAGNTLGKAIQTGGIAFKDYEDEEGKKLTGLALDRARMDDYAAAEQRFGDPMEALRMRTGVETLGQNKLQTDYLTDTYDERVFQGGLGKSNKLRADTAYTNSATALNTANAGRVNLGTEIRAGSKDDEVLYNTARFKRDTAQADGQTLAFKDSSYSGGLIAAQESAQARDNADTTRFGSQAYADSVVATDKRTTAEANLATDTATLQNSVINSEAYKEDFMASELAAIKRTRAMNEVDAIIAQDPKTLEIATANLNSTLNTALGAVQQSIADLELKSTQSYQDNYVSAGLSQAELGAVQGEEAVLLAKQSLAVNSFINEWGKTGNPEDPTSMRNLIAGISKINPIMGQKLSQDYGEHELWEITNRSLKMKAEVNEALGARGAAGAREILDKYNGAALGVDIVQNDDGSMSMVETRAVGPGGQQTEVVRTIASGADEKAFMLDLNAAMDPASIMQFQMNMADINYKNGLAAYNQAQAKAAGIGKPLTMEQWAATVARDPNASQEDLMAASALIFKDDPDAATRWVKLKQVAQGAGSISDGDVPEKVPANVDSNAPVTEEEETLASTLMEQLLTANAEQREELLSGRNKEILAKVAPEFLEMENNKTTAVDAMLGDLQKGNLKLTPEGVEEFSQRYLTLSQKNNPMDKGGSARKIKTRIATAMQEDPMGVLNILIGKLNDQIVSKPVRENGAQKSSRVKKNNLVKQQIVDLERLIETMQGR